MFFWLTPILLLLVSCYAKRNVDAIQAYKGVNGMGMRFVKLEISLRDEAADLKMLTVEGIEVPFDKLNAGNYESFIWLDERTEEGLIKLRNYEGFASKEELCIGVKLAKGLKHKRDVTTIELPDNR